MMRWIFCLVLWTPILAQAPLRAQGQPGRDLRPLVGRVSVVWNYYSQDGSAKPELNSLTNTLTLTYRIFDPDSMRIRFQFRTDLYERNQFASPSKSRFDNRYVVRQLYAAYGGGDRQIKAGKVIPFNTFVDAYPINGVSVEHWSVAGIDVSGFGGTINDYYSNKFQGTGYNYGGALGLRKTSFTVGAGFSGEKFNHQVLQKAFFYGWVRPLSAVQISTKNQYNLTKSLLGYSITNVIYKPWRKLTVRLSGELYDRTATFIPPADTIHSPDRYFFTVKEKNVSTNIWFQAYRNPRIGEAALSLTAKKRIGNGDLVYGAFQVMYRNYYWTRLDVGLNAGITQNQWLDMTRIGVSLGRGFLEERLDATIAVTQSALAWKGTASGGSKGSSKSLTAATLDLSYRFSRAFYGGVSFMQELGDFGSRSSAFVNISYSLR